MRGRQRERERVSLSGSESTTIARLGAWELLAAASAALSATVNDKSMYTLLAWDATLMCCPCNKLPTCIHTHIQVGNALLPGK